jgi:hypothetical protein
MYGRQRERAKYGPLDQPPGWAITDARDESTKDESDEEVFARAREIASERSR